MRKTALVTLRWEDVDLEAGVALSRYRDNKGKRDQRHKIGPEDWRNREKWGPYRDAVNDMVAHTSTAAAPWTLVAGNDKRLARIQVIETLCERLREALEGGS